MENIISKELLSEVLDIKNLDYKECPMFENYLEIYEDNNFISRYNIHELAHKCKKHFYLEHGYSIEEKPYVVIILHHGSPIFEIQIETEQIYNPNRVLKACEWILDKEANK